jgi:hypothetical protein
MSDKVTVTRLQKTNNNIFLVSYLSLNLILNSFCLNPHVKRCTTCENMHHRNNPTNIVAPQVFGLNIYFETWISDSDSM